MKEVEKRGKSYRRDREEWRKPEGKPSAPEAVSISRDETHAEEPVDNEADDDQRASELAKKIEDEQLISEEERKFVTDYLADDAVRLEIRESTRQRNSIAAELRPEESDFRKLDSSLKKNNAFIRKLRNFTEQQCPSIKNEMKSLNLTKYVSEVALALVEAKLKLTDVPSAVSLASEIHQTYAEFSMHFYEDWVKVLAIKKEDKSVSNPSKLRVDLRFFADLVSHGLFSLKSGLQILGMVLTMLVNMDKDTKSYSNISIILSFCKYCGRDYAGLVPKKVKALSKKHNIDISAAMTNHFLPADKQRNLRNLLKEYYSALAKHLVESKKELNAFEKTTRKILMTRGEVPKDRLEKGEAMRASQSKVMTNVQQLAEVLEEEIPVLPAASFDDEEEMHVEFSVPLSDMGKEDGRDGLWDDEDARSFYEDLVDLRTLVPSILYKDSEKATSTMPDIEEDNLDDEMIAQMELESNVVPDEDTSATGLKTEGTNDSDAGNKPSEDDEELAEKADVDAASTKNPKSKAVRPNAASKMLLDAFLTSLPNCISRELMDKAATKFCMELNTKNNRRKLVKALFSVPRTRQDLLPFYARLVATLHPCMPDVAIDLVHMLKQEFRFQLRKKDQINIETKVKVVRFIGELVKFQMYPKSEALLCFRILLYEFMHHNIEMACNFLETAGRYLFRSPDSHPRMKLFMEQLMRKKTVQSLDSRYETMVENAYYFVNPPDLPAISAQEIEQLPPQLLWMKSLILETLESSTVEKVLQSMRKLDWHDASVRNFAVKLLSEPFAVKFYHIRFLAALVCGLLNSQEDVALRVVDRILEEIRCGLEVNASTKHLQRRVASVSYLGELYKVRLVDSTVIFNTLYSLITFASVPFPTWNPLDPPDNLFRIKLICQLLSVCGSFFVAGSTKRKLSCFMLYFQRYYWHKKGHDAWGPDGSKFPVTLTFTIEDLFKELMPHTKIAKNLQDAEKAVNDLELDLSKQIEAVLPPGVTLQAFFPSQGDGDLAPIAEETHEEDRDASNTASYSEGAEEDDEISADVLDDDDEDRRDDDEMYVGDKEDETDDENSSDDDDSGEKAPYQLEDVETRVTDLKREVIECPENDDFVSSFDKLVSESILERSKETAKVPSSVNIAVPIHVRSSNKRKTYEQLQNPEVETSTMKFVLMTRKGNKQQFKDIIVPVDSDLAKNLRSREEVERAEKEHIKRVTLDINERQEQEDFMEMLQAGGGGKMKTLDNANPSVKHVSTSRVISSADEDDSLVDEVTPGEIFDLIRNLNDPEHPLTLEQLSVVEEDKIRITGNVIDIEFTPTVPHCSMATLIGLSIRVKLLRSLPDKFKFSAQPSTTPGEANLVEILEKRFPKGSVTVQDISGGCGSMYEVHVTDAEFKGMPVVKQHRLVQTRCCEIMNQTLSPFVYWAESKTGISLRVDLKDVRAADVSYEGNELKFKAIGLGVRGTHEYSFLLKLFKPLQDCQYRVLDRCVEISLQKCIPEWWNRILEPDHKKLSWLKTDFDKWQSEDDEEIERRDVFEDYPDLYNKLLEEETGKKLVRNSRKLYLFMYNLWLLVTFGFILATLGINYAQNKNEALKTSWEAIGWHMKMNTVFQFAEALHAALQWTRGSPWISFIQTFGRFFFLFVLIDAEERMQKFPAVFYLVVVYSLVELFRYSYYMFHVYGIQFDLVTWLRYTVWIPLYPLGFCLEAFVAFRSLPFFEETGKFSVGLPNAWNFAFHLPSLLRIYLLFFCFPSRITCAAMDPGEASLVAN
ncbi:unnamed protein product [Notodromas monacha]|uniref:very-long-chain (3R)-3-hydroxyacyl-CoA dehydratase n=1 Tax=Notodromas monacha TaxID=399045 RepID=A0A7R9BVP2_9CRUS|nr:unnamed protein product [Notodromas monacha]CAG0922644.1 unnamed protein product [Notodromas monacha]